MVVHPDGAVSGPPADAAAEVGRLATQERQGELDRQAARTIQQLLAGDRADHSGPVHRSGDRTWSVPATAAWTGGSQPLDRRQPRARARHAFPQHHHRSIHGRRRITEASQGGKTA